jgi:hypothetical protein
VVIRANQQLYGNRKDLSPLEQAHVLDRAHHLYQLNQLSPNERNADRDQRLAGSLRWYLRTGYDPTKGRSPNSEPWILDEHLPYAEELARTIIPRHRLWLVLHRL